MAFRCLLSNPMVPLLINILLILSLGAEKNKVAATKLPSVRGMVVEGFYYPPYVKSPGSNNTLFLGGTGVRGIEINGKFIKFTTLGIYLGKETLPFLAAKWKGNTVANLSKSIDFFVDIATGPFEKLTRVGMIMSLSGEEFVSKVAENCIDIMVSAGKYGECEKIAVEKLKEAFEGRNCSSGSSIYLTQSTNGSITVGFSNDSSVARVESKVLGEAYLLSVIGRHGVSPAAKRSLAARIAVLLANYSHDQIC